MSRARAAAAPGISLFPFLAVLLCTMGALLVLLVLFSRSAQEGREAAAVQAAADLQLEAESLRWRLDQLEGMKARTLEELAKSRIQLATIEDNARDLADEFEKVEREIEALHAGGQPDVDHEEKIAQLQQRLAEARGELEAAEARAAERPPAYAVVPYQGSNGTHRRPLYIECAVDGVFLQPEGIRLRPSDFEGPPGPGNPLASALRAAREHLAERRLTTAEPDAQPYPLLLVRPSGVMAYYAAREAIASWGSDFGYQLVDEDWELAFPPRDAALAEVERLAIDEARRRLEWLANVRAARSRGPRQPVQYRPRTAAAASRSKGGPACLAIPRGGTGRSSRQAATASRAVASSAAGVQTARLPAAARHPRESSAVIPSLEAATAAASLELPVEERAREDLPPVSGGLVSRPAAARDRSPMPEVLVLAAVRAGREAGRGACRVAVRQPGSQATQRAADRGQAEVTLSPARVAATSPAEAAEDRPDLVRLTA